MSKTFICKHCIKEKPVNIRLIVPQHYCGDAPCQRDRKAEWQRHKKTTDADYRARQQQCVEQWQQQPLHRYMSQYRQEHRDYVDQNRDQHKVRNQKRRLGQQQKIVNMDALVKQLEKLTIYLLAHFPTAEAIARASIDEFAAVHYGKNQWSLPLTFIEEMKALASNSIAYDDSGTSKKRKGHLQKKGSGMVR